MIGTPAARAVMVAGALLVLAVRASAEKTVTVKIEHAAALDRALAGKQVVFGRISGDCASEFSDSLRQDLISHGIPVVSSPAAANQTPAISISIDVTRCDAHPLPPIMGPGLPATHISRTEGHFLASIRAADPATGAELAALAVRGDAQKENESQTTTPEYPSPPEVKQMAIQRALLEAQRLYTPWIENRGVPVMDNKECGLKQAYELVKAGDYQGFLRQSRANADSCGPGSKAAGEAWYNLGVAALLARRYDDALAAFAKAQELRGNKLAAGLVEICRTERAALAARTPPPEKPPERGAATQIGIVMTNDFVVKLVQGNVDEAEILKMIAAQPGRFSLGPDDLVKLKQSSVPDAVIAAMRDKK